MVVEYRVQVLSQDSLRVLLGILGIPRIDTYEVPGTFHKDAPERVDPAASDVTPCFAPVFSTLKREKKRI